MGHRDGNETVYCFDAATGRELWKHSYSRGAHRQSAPRRARRVADHRRRHAFTRSAKKAICIASTRRRARSNGAFTSRAISACRRPSGASVRRRSFERTADRRRRRSDRRSTKNRAASCGANSSASATVRRSCCSRRRKKRVVAALTNDDLVVVRAVDGTTVASYPWTSDYVTTGTTPVVGGRTLFVVVGLRHRLRAAGVQRAGLTPLFRNKEMSNHMCTSMLWEGHYYGIDGNSHNGATMQTRLPRRRNRPTQMGTARLRLRSADAGRRQAADPQRRRLSLHRESHAEGVRRTRPHPGLRRPHLDDAGLGHGRIYCRSESGTVVCLDVSTLVFKNF